MPTETAHPAVAQLADALQRLDGEAWQRAWAAHQEALEEQRRWQRYQHDLARLEQLAPDIRPLLEATRGDPHAERFWQQLDRAWAHAAARTWLLRTSDPGSYEQLDRQWHEADHRCRQTLLALAAERAWLAFLQRMSPRTHQSLVAWKQAMRRYGKGTGKHAARHRRKAQRYLDDCLADIPAWIMPLHRVWESTPPQPALFDTVIIDEASQAGVDSLLLLLLCKRIVVVGDDMQNTPEAVGVDESHLVRLQRQYLAEFRYRDEFRLNSSLYDHAERIVGEPLSLREHFRCVPEIIRFSNELCYRAAPLVPLRQPPRDRLPPLVHRYVPQGACQGQGSRLVNPAEAQQVVQTIEHCLADPAYRGKSLGVIALQGHAQAELIEQLLAQRLDPQVRYERKLRCGDSSTFQGDQRDVMFLSLVVAPNHNYTALTRIEWQRRFNVAMSRARDQVWLFHSVQAAELRPHDLRYTLLTFFLDAQRPQAPPPRPDQRLAALLRAIEGRQRTAGLQPAPFANWFEVDLACALLGQGFDVRPQHEVAGYHVDLVIEGGTRRLAIECDGDSWHGPQAYEADLDRQRQLERAGWRFLRVRESEFYADRPASLKRIAAVCRQLEIPAFPRA